MDKDINDEETLIERVDREHYERTIELLKDDRDRNLQDVTIEYYYDDRCWNFDYQFASLGGRLVTSEHTLIPNSYFNIKIQEYFRLHNLSLPHDIKPIKMGYDEEDDTWEVPDYEIYHIKQTWYFMTINDYFQDENENLVSKEEFEKILIETSQYRHAWRRRLFSGSTIIEKLLSFNYTVRFGKKHISR